MATGADRIGFPLKAISDSGGKAITIPEGNRSGVGAKRRWLFDVAKTDRNRQGESLRSEAEEGSREERKRYGKTVGSPLPRLSTQWPGARLALRIVVGQHCVMNKSAPNSPSWESEDAERVGPPSKLVWKWPHHQISSASDL